MEQDQSELVQAIHALARQLYIETAVVGTHRISLDPVTYDSSPKHMSEIYDMLSQIALLKADLLAYTTE